MQYSVFTAQTHWLCLVGFLGGGSENTLNGIVWTWLLSQPYLYQRCDRPLISMFVSQDGGPSPFFIKQNYRIGALTSSLNIAQSGLELLSLLTPPFLPMVLGWQMCAPIHALCSDGAQIQHFGYTKQAFYQLNYVQNLQTGFWFVKSWAVTSLCATASQDFLAKPLVPATWAAFPDND